MKLSQVIFQGNSIRQCAGAVGTDIFGGCHVLGLHVTLNIEFLAGQISAAKTLPLPSINPDHQGLKTFWKRRREMSHNCVWVNYDSNALFVTSWKMISKTNPIFQNHWTQWTSVTRGSNMFGLNMIPDICPVGLVSTLHTLPLTTPYTCQKVIDIGWKKKRSLKMWHLFWNKIV